MAVSAVEGTPLRSWRRRLRSWRRACRWSRNARSQESIHHQSTAAQTPPIDPSAHLRRRRRGRAQPVSELRGAAGASRRAPFPMGDASTVDRHRADPGHPVHRRGYYRAQLEAVCAHFPRSQVLIVAIEQLRDGPLQALRGVHRFLGLGPPRLPVQLPAHNAGRGTRTELRSPFHVLSGLRLVSSLARTLPESVCTGPERTVGVTRPSACVRSRRCPLKVQQHRTRPKGGLVARARDVSWS